MTPAEAYLLDTTIASFAWYEGSTRHLETRERLGAIGDDLVFVSAVSVAEVEYGLNLFPMARETQNGIRNAMRGYTVLPIDHHTAQNYGEIKAILFQKYAPRDRRDRIASRYVEDLTERTLPASTCFRGARELHGRERVQG